MLQLNQSLLITVVIHSMIRKLSLPPEIILFLTCALEEKLEADYAQYSDLRRDRLRVLFAGEKVYVSPESTYCKNLNSLLI
jgi:hypothetical protein